MDKASNPLPTAVGISSTNFSALTGLFSFSNNIDPSNPSAFSFQEALRPLLNTNPLDVELWTESPDSSPLYVFTDACQTNGTQNCTISCRDPSQAFSSLTTLHNCASYPFVAQLYAEGNISSTLVNGPSLDSLGFLKGKQGTGFLDDITKTVTNCLGSYCTTQQCQQQLQRAPASVFNSSDAFFKFFNTSDPQGYNGYPDPFEFADYVCGIQSAGLNPDVGGIGVFISYWIQSGIAILGSIFVIWWGWGVYYLCFITRSLRQGHKAGKEYARKMGAKYGNRRLPGAIAALTDFQKAQCFFMLAINIAAQVSKHRGNNSPNNLQELYNNNSLIKAISVSGYLPVTFTLLTLHNVGMVSWYLIVLSVLTVAFSVATSVDIGAFAPSPADIAYLETQSRINGTEACGNRNLLVYCLAPPYGHDAESYVGFEVTDNNAINGSIAGGYSTMAFCIVVLLLLIVDQTGWIEKIRKRKADSVLPKSQRFIFDNFFTIRGVQLLLTTLLWVPSTLPSLGMGIIFAAFSQVALLYIFLASNLRYEPRKIWAGRMFNKWVVLAADVLSLVFSMAWVIVLPAFHDNYYDSTTMFLSIGITLGVLLCVTFLLTITLTSMHIHGTRKGRSKTYKQSGPPYAARRQMEGIVSPIKPLFQPIDSFLRSETIKSRVKRIKRDMKYLIGPDDLTTKVMDLTICLLYIVFHGLYFYWFVVYAQYLGSFYSSVDTGSWSFGQVVAITVWAQPLCEYFHLEIRGMTRGFQHRLMWPYKVVRQDDDIETGHQPQSPSLPPPSPKRADSTDQPKRASYEMVRQDAKEAVPSTPHLEDEDVTTLSRGSLSKDVSQMSAPIDVEEISEPDQGRDHEYENPRSGSEFSWEQDHGAESDLEHRAPHSSYLEIPEPDGEELDSFHGQELERDHEPHWQIPESVLLRSDDLRFE